MDEFDVYIFQISKEEIESCNTGRLLTGIAQAAEKSGGIARTRGRIGLNVDGYKDDPRELWHIPEVKKYFEAIDNAIPWFVFFLINRESPTSLFLYISFFRNIEYTGDKTIPENVKAERLFSDILSFLNERGEAINGVCHQSTEDGFPLHYAEFFADVMECFNLQIDREKFYKAFE